MDNSVLSAFTKINLLSELKGNKGPLYITSDILLEYSSKWKSNLEDLVIVKNPKFYSAIRDSTISKADSSILELAFETGLILATDDKRVRTVAIEKNIPLTGSIGLLRSMYAEKIIQSKNEYIRIILELSKDLYLTNDLISWALDV